MNGYNAVIIYDNGTNIYRLDRCDLVSQKRYEMGQKKNHHIVSVFYQKKFYEFESNNHGIYFDLRYLNLDYKYGLASHMFIKDAYTILDQEGNETDKVEDTLGKIESECKKVFDEYINIIEVLYLNYRLSKVKRLTKSILRKYIRKHNKYFNKKIKNCKDYNKEIDNVIASELLVRRKLFLFLFLQILRMPDIFLPIHNKFSEFVSTLYSCAKRCSTYKEFIATLQEDERFKNPPHPPYDEQEYQEFRNCSDEQLNEFSISHKQLGHTNPNFNVGRLFATEQILKLMTAKSNEVFLTIVKDNEKLNLTDFGKSSYNITWIRTFEVLMRKTYEVLIAKEPVFILPLAIMPTNIVSNFYVPLTPKIAIKFHESECIPDSNEVRKWILRDCKNGEIQQINAELIKRTLELKDLKKADYFTNYSFKRDEPLYPKLSVCFPCELKDFETFKSNYVAGYEDELRRR